MAAIIDQPLSKTARKPQPKIDMTPMVNLGFLLITFFIFTTSLTQPTVTKLVMPKVTGNEPPTLVDERTLLTVVVDAQTVYAYEGALQKAIQANLIRRTTLNAANGFGQLVRQKQNKLATQNLRDDLMVLIKPTATASYQNLMDALDEMQINGVKRYAVLDPSGEEKSLVASR